MSRGGPSGPPTSNRARVALVVVALVLVALVALGAGDAGTALVVERPIASPDAIISLASHEWERLPETTLLAHRYPEARVLLTLPPAVNEYNCHDCSQRVGLLVRNGIPESRIRILPIKLSGTFGEAVVALEFAKREHIRRLLVVTSPYHTRRSLATFQTVFEGTGVDIGIQPAIATSPARPGAWWRSPYDRWYVRYEWAAIAYYLVRHHVNAITSATGQQPPQRSAPFAAAALSPIRLACFCYPSRVRAGPRPRYRDPSTFAGASHLPRL